MGEKCLVCEGLEEECEEGVEEVGVEVVEKEEEEDVEEAVRPFV